MMDEAWKGGRESAGLICTCSFHPHQLYLPTRSVVHNTGKRSYTRQWGALQRRQIRLYKLEPDTATAHAGFEFSTREEPEGNGARAAWLLTGDKRVCIVHASSPYTHALPNLSPRCMQATKVHVGMTHDLLLTSPQ